MTKTGTPVFNAPEIYTETFYDNKIDIWSCGVIFYTLLSGGDTPFWSENIPKLLK